ncbi:MAG: lipopolysaccharide heptosyltransferase I [Tepidisphaeraceae bacterium]|jgi:lipopolysaccharide heptosyltransferase I
MTDALTRDPERILLIKPSSLGDVVHALPVLNLLRRRFPRARISWMLAAACAGLLEGHPQLDEIILFDRKRLGTAWRSPRALQELWNLNRGLRHRRFNLVIDLQGLLRSGWMTWRTGAADRVGFANAREGAWLFYNWRIPIETMEQHAVERYLKVAEAVGCGREPVEFRFHVTDEDRAQVDALIPPREKFAVLLPATNWATKRWPAERFAAMVGAIEKRFGLKSVVAGAADAAGLAPRIQPHFDVTGKTRLRQLVALLERASLVIANDSGPMHIAAALGRPLVCVFGPTNPVRTGPFGRNDSVVRVTIPCAPCYSRTCSHRSCLEWLEIEPVLRAAERQITRP